MRSPYTPELEQLQISINISCDINKLDFHIYTVRGGGSYG